VNNNIEMQIGEKFHSRPEGAGRIYELVDIVEVTRNSGKMYHLLFSFTSKTEAGEIDWFTRSLYEIPDIMGRR